MREARTPLILWICAAICVHFLFGGGGEVVADIHDDHVFLHHMATDIRERVKRDEATFEVFLDSSKPAEKEKPKEDVPPPPPPKPKVEPPKPMPKPPELAKVEKKQPEPKKDDKKKVVVVQEDKKQPPLPPPPPSPDHRIAVQQHVEPKQEDNPNARFIADQANKVNEETVAKLTSHDRDETNPTPRGQHSGAEKDPGDSEQTKVAEAEEHKGTKNAPGEKGTEAAPQKDPMPQTPPAKVAVEGPKTAQLAQSGGDGRTANSQAPQPTMAPGAAGPATPDVSQSATGSGWTFNPVRENAGQGLAQDDGKGSAQQRPDAQQAAPPLTSTQWLGLGGRPGPGQINLNLTQMGVVASVGADQLRKEREADGERRRSEHRGSWVASNFERWRSAIENYVTSVKPGNQTALNTAQVPFAAYLNAMHNRIHPLFAESFLESLDSLPATHPLNDQHLITSLEIVLTKDGHVHKMGIVKTSGITMFDIAALDAVQRASPFGPAPAAIVSPDGNVYLHWEFHRDEVYACSTMNARPFLLNVPAKGPNEEQPPGTPNPPGAPSSPHERGIPTGNTSEEREGMLAPTALHAPHA